VLGEEHPDTLRLTTNFGILCIAMERFEEAAELFEVRAPGTRGLDRDRDRLHAPEPVLGRKP
jgi:hypothetical protein